MQTSPTCTYARLTPVGRGAIAVVRVRGTMAEAIVDREFQSATAKSLAAFATGRIIFGNWSSGEELVVCKTNANEVEVHCHGGEAAVQAITESLQSQGCVAESECADGTTIENAALQSLAKATTEKVAAILLNQYRGAFRNELQSIIKLLEEKQLAAAAARLATLRERSTVGRHLTNPWKLAIVGETNVGKSSLMNCLVGFERSITHDEPGVTRDLVSAESAIEGWPIQFIDTAGIRESANEIETAGVALSRDQLKRADVVIAVLDSTRPIDSQLETLGELPKSTILVLNKTDLQAVEFENGIATCALSGLGLPELLQAISHQLADASIDWTAADLAVPFTEHQIAAITSAAKIIDDDPTGAANLLRQLVSPIAR